MTQNYYQPVPAVPQTQMVDSTGAPLPVWYDFFLSMWRRTGGASGSISAVLDGLTTIVGSTIYRASSGWIGLNPGSQNQVLKMGATVPAWSLIDGNSFAAETANAFFAGPVIGGAANPAFRTLATADLNSVAGAIPGTAHNTAAAAGNVGELITINVPSVSAVSLVSATPKDVGSLTLTPGDWDLWSTVGFLPTGGASVTKLSAWLNTTTATDPNPPNSGAYFLSNPATAFTANQVNSVGSMAMAVNVNTTVFLSCNTTFTIGNLSAFGFIGARRRR